jgi:spore germination protein
MGRRPPVLVVATVLASLASLAAAVSGCNRGGSSLGPAQAGGTTGGAAGGTVTSGGTGGLTSPPAGQVPRLAVSGWLPDWSGADGKASVQDNTGTLDEVNPTWYSLNADGTLRARSFARDRRFVADRHAQGMKVLPMIDDFSTGGASAGAGPVVRDPTTRATMLASILAEVDGYDLDGIDIDYEGMGQVSRDAFSAFMADLSRELHARGKILSAAIYPKLSEPGGWSGPQSHDYAALGRAVDEFKIMLYGYTGPIAPTGQMEKFLDFAKTLVPADKIYAGINFYGYEKWGTSKRAHTQKSAEALAQVAGVVPQLDPVSGEVHFTFDVSGVQHSVWYVNGDAIARKCQVALQRGVKGIAIWRLGGEKVDIWDAIRAAR